MCSLDSWKHYAVMGWLLGATLYILKICENNILVCSVFMDMSTTCILCEKEIVVFVTWLLEYGRDVMYVATRLLVIMSIMKYVPGSTDVLQIKR